MTHGLPGVVNAMAFSPDGKELWVAHGNSGIEVRSWPALDLMRVVALPTSQLVAHPTETLFAAALSKDIVVLDERGVVIHQVQPPEHESVMTLAFHERGYLDVLTYGGDRVVKLSRVDFDSGQLVARAEQRLVNRTLWWAALAPSKKRAFFAMDDCAPEEWDTATGRHRHGWTWPEGFSSRRSWLSVDVSADERALICSNKGCESYVMWLDQIGEIERIVPLTWRSDSPSSFLRPGRGGASTLHPQEDVAITIDTHGQILIRDANTGRVIDEEPWTFEGGYRWETRTPPMFPRGCAGASFNRQG